MYRYIFYVFLFCLVLQPSSFMEPFIHENFEKLIVSENQIENIPYVIEYGQALLLFNEGMHTK